MTWTPQDLESFVDLLSREAEAYERMVTLTGEQETALASGDTDKLVRIVEEKGKRLVDVEQLELALGPLKDRWNRTGSGQARPEARARLESAVDRVRQVLRRLVEAEGRWQAMVDGAQKGTAQELRRVDAARRVNKAYGGQAGPAQSRFLDERP